MLRRAPALPLSRGVYAAPFRSTADEVVLIAIDRRGRCLCQRIVQADADEDSAWAGLRAFLDREDPPLRSSLRLVDGPRLERAV